MSTKTTKQSRSALLVAAIVVAAMAIRTYHLGDRSIWFDEASSWRTTRFGLLEMIARVARNSHLPLYFVLLKAWTAAFGDSLIAMRGLNVLLAGATIIGIYLFVAEAFGPQSQTDDVGAKANARWIGLFAAALAALSIRQILVTWDARMYALATMLVAFSAWSLLRALQPSDHSRRRWVAHVIWTVLLAYTHPFALFTIAAEVVFLTGYFITASAHNLKRLVSDRRFRACVKAYLVIGALWALWLPTMVKQVHRVEDHFWTGPLTANDVLQRCYDMFIDGSASPTRRWLAAAACLAIVVSLIIRGTRGAWLTASLAVVPFAAGAIASRLGSNIFLSRYLAFAQIFLLVGIAAAIGGLRRRMMRNSVALLLLSAAAVECWHSWFALDMAPYPGMRGLIEYIESRHEPADLIVVSSSWFYFPALYHSHNRLACRAYSDGSPFDDYKGGPIAVDTDVIHDADLARLSNRYVWLISGDDPPDAISLPATWTLVENKIFPEMSRRRFDLHLRKYKAPATDNQ